MNGLLQRVMRGRNDQNKVFTVWYNVVLTGLSVEYVLPVPHS